MGRLCKWLSGNGNTNDRHRWTGRYEAHLWDKLSWNVTQKKKGKQGMSNLSLPFFFLSCIELIVLIITYSQPNNVFLFYWICMAVGFLCNLLGLSSLSRWVQAISKETILFHCGSSLVTKRDWTFSFLINISGAYDDEEAAARAYDMAALKYWGTSTFTNFPVHDILLFQL